MVKPHIRRFHHFIFISFSRYREYVRPSFRHRTYQGPSEKYLHPEQPLQKVSLKNGVSNHQDNPLPCWHHLYPNRAEHQIFLEYSFPVMDHQEMPLPHLNS